MGKKIAFVLAVMVVLSVFMHQQHFVSSIHAEETRVSVLIGEQEQEWLLAIMAPVAAKLTNKEKVPLLLAIDNSLHKDTRNIIQKLGNANCMLFATSTLKLYGHISVKKKKT